MYRCRLSADKIRRLKTDEQKFKRSNREVITSSDEESFVMKRIQDRPCVLYLTSSSEVGSRSVNKNTGRTKLEEKRRRRKGSVIHNVSSSFSSLRKNSSSSKESRRNRPISTNDARRITWKLMEMIVIK